MDRKEFDEIRPYERGEMKQAFEELINDRQFSLLLKGFVPWLPKAVRNGLLRLAFIGVKTPLDFQLRFMKPVVWHFVRKYTDGLSFEDSNINSHLNERYTFVSNHRDIVLDSAFLDVSLNKKGYPTTVEIGIGDNLLIYPWIKRLVRMNKAFTVRRGLTAHEMMRSSQLMSSYIHYAVTQKKENIWIAQREGRAKDSDDRTQESVLKMLAMGGDLKELNIVPLTISYEFDPCDYLKAQEFQQKRDNPNFKKSKQDDLDNMKTGIFGYKGRVHYQCGTPINEWIDELRDLPKNEFFKAVAQRMDLEIHRHYSLYPCNYIALDLLENAGVSSSTGSPGNTSFASHYTPSDVTRFEEYLSAQLAKIKIPNKDEAFLRERMLTMYANPLRNYLKAKE
ncbi:MAG: 1-acyl-sn-glycerol-3-phosphate acyltransferase [Prevotella sp.]|nr:1-acyl-sn-glycerol-3-phosphate acyltransferase [Prevotella sp.]